MLSDVFLKDFICNNGSEPFNRGSLQAKVGMATCDAIIATTGNQRPVFPAQLRLNKKIQMPLSEHLDGGLYS